MELFKHYHNQTFLNQIAQDKDLLQKSIKETGGFVLYLMEQNKIFPQVDYFFEDNAMPVYAVQFVLKNYTKLSIEQQRILIEYQNKYSNYNYETDDFKEVAHDEVPVVPVEQDIEYYLKNKLSLPKQSTLTFELIQAYHKELHAILSNEDIATERVIRKSMKDFTIEQFFALDKGFVNKHPYMFDYFPQYFSNPEFKAYFKEIMLSDKRRLGLHHFENYTFEKEDTELLHFLIGDRFAPDYKDVAKLNGAEKILPKIEFFQKINPLDISYFTDEELIENKEAIQLRWLQSFDKENKKRRNSTAELGYEHLGKVFSVKGSLEQFKIMMNDDYFAQLISKIDDAHLHSIYKDDQDTREKINYFKTLTFDYLNTHPKEYYKFSMSNMIDDLFQNYFRQDKVERAKQFYETVIPETLKGDGFVNLTGKYHPMINHHSVAFMADLVKNYPSINLLLVLLDSYQVNVDAKKEHIAKELKEHINNLIPLVNAEDAKQVLKAFNYKKPLKILYNNDNPRGSDSVNFLNHNNDLANMSKHTKSIILDMDKHLLTHILNNNIVLSDEEYATLLNNSKTDKITFSFIQKYTQKNKDTILANEAHVTRILAHPKAQDIVAIDNSQNEQKAYIQFIQNSDKYWQLSELEDKLNSKNEAEKDVIYQKKQQIEKENEALLPKLSLSFITNKTDELLKQHDFKSLHALSKTRLFEHEKFQNYAQTLPFKDLIRFVDNEHFMTLCSYKMGYNDESTFSFGKYSNNETYQLAQKVLAYVEKNQGSKRNDREKMTWYFKEANKEGLKQFFIDYLPNELFYSYTLRGCLKGIQYTNEEILNAYINAEKTNFFSDKDVNARFCHTLSDFFKDNEEQYLQMLELTKEAHPKLYLLLTYNDVCSQFSDKEFPDMNRDESKMHYYVKHFDEKAILKGVHIILDEMEKDDSNYNQKLAANVITQALYSSYFDKDTGNGREYFSLFSDERVHEMMVSIWNKAPLFILERHHLGTHNNLGQYIVEHIREFDNDRMPLDFIYPNFSLKPDYFKSDNESTKQNILTIFNGFMDYYIKSEQFDKLDYMIFLVDRAKFFSDKISYEYRPDNLHFNSHDEIIDIIFEDDATLDKIKNYKFKSMLDNTVEVQEAVKPKKTKKI